MKLPAFFRHVGKLTLLGGGMMRIRRKKGGGGGGMERLAKGAIGLTLAEQQCYTGA